MSQDDSDQAEKDEGSEDVPDAGQDPPRDRGNHGARRNRLPPPAFPPGARRRAVRRRGVKESSEPAPADSEGVGVEFPRDAFISPDEPIRKKGRGIPDEAYISPDDPLVPVLRDEEGHVTGMSLLPVAPAESRSSRERDKPSIHELPYLLDQLAEHVQEAGEQALEVHPDMGHFQASLRAFLKGYLAGSRD